MNSLLKTPIIPVQADQLWRELPETWRGPAPLLILCRPQPDGAPAAQMLQELAQRACGFQPDAYRVLEVAAGSIIPWSKLKSEFQPGYVFLFGIQPSELAIQARLLFHFPNRFGDALFILTYDAGEMAANKNFKNELWQVLKGLFQKG